MYLLTLIYLLIKFSGVLSFESNDDNKGTTVLSNFNQNTQQSIYSGSENPVFTQTSDQATGSYSNIPLASNYKTRDKLDYSTLFKPYASSPLNFDPFSIHNNNTSKATSYFSTLQPNLNLKYPLGAPNNLGDNQNNNVFGIYGNIRRNQVFNTGTYDPKIVYENAKNNFESNREMILNPGKNFVQYNLRQQGYDRSYQLEDGPNNRKMQVFRLIPKATIEAIPLPPVTEYNKRSEDEVIFKVEQPLLPTHGTKNETQFDDELEETPHEKIVENPDDFPPQRPKPHIPTTTTEKPQLDDNLTGTPSPKLSTFEENEEPEDSTPPETSTLNNEELSSSTPTQSSTSEEDEELTETPPPPTTTTTTTTTTTPPPITSSSPSPPPPAHYIPYSNSPPYYSPPYYGPPPPPPYPYDDYHSPCVYGPHYYPPLDCRPPYDPTPCPHHRPPDPPKPYGGPPHQHSNYRPLYEPPHENVNYNEPDSSSSIDIVKEFYSELSLDSGQENYDHPARAPVNDYESAYPPYSPSPVNYNKPAPHYPNYNEDQYHPSKKSLQPHYNDHHSHEPPFHQNTHQTSDQHYQPPNPLSYDHFPNPYPHPHHKQPYYSSANAHFNPPSGPYHPNGNYAVKNKIIANNPSGPLPYYPNDKHEYTAQPKIYNNLRPVTKCDLKISARLSSQLRPSSGAPFPPYLDEYYRPIPYGNC